MADDETAAAATRPDVARETSVAAEGAGVHCSAALTSSASGPGKPDGEATTRPVPSAATSSAFREVVRIAHMTADFVVSQPRWERLARALWRAKAEHDELTEALLDAERRALAYQEFVAYTLDEFGERMPNQWKAHARAVLADD